MKNKELPIFKPIDGGINRIDFTTESDFCFKVEKHKRPSIKLREDIEQFKKDNPDHEINKPYESEFFKSGKFNKLINPKEDETKTTKEKRP